MSTRIEGHAKVSGPKGFVHGREVERGFHASERFNCVVVRFDSQVSHLAQRSNTGTSTSTHSYREIQNDVDDIVQLVNLHERIKKDSENVFQRHELNTVRNFFSNHESEITIKSDF